MSSHATSSVASWATSASEEESCAPDQRQSGTPTSIPRKFENARHCDRGEVGYIIASSFVSQDKSVDAHFVFTDVCFFFA